MKKYKKLAVFGGTFSPVHNGHLHAMRAYAETVRPDVLYVIPTAIPPHKIRSDDATDEQRLHMLRIAVQSIRFPCEVVVSDIEIARGGKSYTVDTVEALHEIAEEVVIYCGTDMLLCLDEWNGAQKLLRLASVAYMQREADRRYFAAVADKAAALSEKYGTQIFERPYAAVEVSSSAVRACIRRGEDITALVGKDVAAYIRSEGLYQKG